MPGCDTFIWWLERWLRSLIHKWQTQRNIDERYRRQSPKDGIHAAGPLQVSQSQPDRLRGGRPDRVCLGSRPRSAGASGREALGKVGKDVTIEEGYATSRAVALSILASLKAELGDLDRVKRLVRLFGMVNAAPGFDRMPQVIDGASDFFYELLGPKMGQHARSAVGLAELPHGISDQRRVRDPRLRQK